MSSTEHAQKLVRLLDALRALELDDELRASRPIGYAYARMVDIEHQHAVCPDKTVYTLDPLARRISRSTPEVRTREGPDGV